MENIIRYKDFIGTVQFSADDMVFHGKIEFITDLVTFEGASVEELVRAFEEAVEDYIELCEELDKTPQRSFKGTFNVRISPELHRRAALASIERGISLNKLVEESLEKCVKPSA
jgi:predicted HicB family RNase H-like nuclease